MKITYLPAKKANRQQAMTLLLAAVTDCQRAMRSRNIKRANAALARMDAAARLAFRLAEPAGDHFPDGGNMVCARSCSERSRRSEAVSPHDVAGGVGVA